MVWLQPAKENGNALYLDIHRVEQQREGYAVTGMLGDGHGECEVLVEVGATVEVTYVDEWLPGRSLPAFMIAAGRDAVTAAVSAAAADLVFCVENFPSIKNRPRRQVTGYRADGRWMALRSPCYGEQLELPVGVAEVPSGWRLGAA